MNIAIGSDHGGYDLKCALKEYLESKGIAVLDVGVDKKLSADYPDYAKRVGLLINHKRADFGILICRTGLGMCIAGNKVKGILAAVCYDENFAVLARSHNNANVLCLGADYTDKKKAEKIVDTFLNTEFQGGRHFRRVRKVKKMEV
ncbi:MAG: ribose 5-phosphate isomerase B [Candidatus Marinimicrobia bacterium]|nr:ribose 5-phosphate isomerase B [Candidatus Neomarinimicrobiota bacterium]